MGLGGTFPPRANSNPSSHANPGAIADAATGPGRHASTGWHTIAWPIPHRFAIASGQTDPGTVALRNAASWNSNLPKATCEAISFHHLAKHAFIPTRIPCNRLP